MTRKSRRSPTPSQRHKGLPERIKHLWQKSLPHGLAHTVSPGPGPVLWHMGCAEQPIEDHQMRGEILVIGGRILAMMPLMKIRPGNQPAKLSQIDPGVGMIEEHLEA